MLLNGVQLQCLKIHQYQITGLGFLRFLTEYLHAFHQLIQAFLTQMVLYFFHIEDTIFPVIHRYFGNPDICSVWKKQPPSPVPV